MEELKQLKEEIQKLINEHIKCNGKNSIHEKALNKVIDLIDTKIQSITLNIKNKSNKENKNN